MDEAMDDAPRVMVCGQPKLLWDVTDSDQAVMSDEEHRAFFELCASMDVLVLGIPPRLGEGVFMDPAFEEVGRDAQRLRLHEGERVVCMEAHAVPELDEESVGNKAD
eukprot:4649521-Pleurochrysis_carterae.AAC.1